MPAENEKEPPTPRWHPETRADKKRTKHREEQAKAKGHGPEPMAPPAEPGAPPRPAPSDEFDLERVRCSCGRRTFAMCMVDVRGVPETIRGDAEEVCDACWTHWVRSRKLSRAELAELQGAPPEIVRHIKAHGHPHVP